MATLYGDADFPPNIAGFHLPLVGRKLPALVVVVSFSVLFFLHDRCTVRKRVPTVRTMFSLRSGVLGVLTFIAREISNASRLAWPKRNERFFSII